MTIQDVGGKVKMWEKTAALQIIRNDIMKIGYGSKNLVDNYSISIKGNNAMVLDLVAFGDENIYDTSTSCISVKWIENKYDVETYIQNAGYLATPVMLLGTNNQVDVISVKKNKSEKIITLQYSELYPYFQDNRFDFSSTNILQAKYGFKQLNLFDAFDLFEFAEKANAQILGEEFKKGLFAGKKCLDNMRISGDENYRTLTSITMYVLAAIILNHKIDKPSKINNINELMDKLSKKFNNYFNNEYIYSFGKETIEAIFNALDKGITYNSVNNEMLGHFYETTLLGENELKRESIRRDFGIYYTPKTLGDDIVNHIPIEFIEMNERYVLDGSCGSGSLLLSAYKRFEKILPKRWSSEEKHNYLTRVITGIDKDRFAKEVARMALLLYSLPHGNHWNIECDNFLTPIKKINQPMIIVANPPFKEIRKLKQEQIAAEFLNKYIDILHEYGFIGIILPESFLENNSCKDTRKRLLQEFDILEIWSMPGSIFDNNCATCVIIAKKINPKNELDNSNNLIKIRILNRDRNSIDRYLKKKDVNFEFFIKNKSEWLNNVCSTISYSPVDVFVKKIECHSKLKNVVKGVQGLLVMEGYPYVSYSFVENYSKYIHNAKGCFEPFSIKWEKQKDYKYIKYDIETTELQELQLRFKGLRLRYKYRELYESEKVLIKRSSTPGTFWCINAAIDREKCYPGSSYYCVIPKNENLTVEELVAVINSRAANAYIRKLTRKRTLTVDVINMLPVPVFNETQKKMIIELVRKIEFLKLEENQKKVIAQYERILNEIINEAYGLNEKDIELLNEYYMQFKNEYPSKQKEKEVCEDKMWSVTGEIIDIDYDNMIIKAEFVEFNDIRNVEIAPNLPGWMVRKGICFKADISERAMNEVNIKIFNPKPLNYSYLNDNDLQNYILQNVFDSEV